MIRKLESSFLFYLLVAIFLIVMLSNLAQLELEKKIGRYGRLCVVVQIITIKIHLVTILKIKMMMKNLRIVILQKKR